MKKQLEPKPEKVKTTIMITRECHDGLKQIANGRSVGEAVEALYNGIFNNDKTEKENK